MKNKDFDKYLDNAFADINVCGVIHSPSFVLQNLDPIRYDVMKSEWEKRVKTN